MKSLILSIFSLLTISANSQNLDKKYIDDWLIKCDTAIKLNKINVYVLDGTSYFPIDTTKLDVALKALNYNNLSGIDYFRTEEVFPTTEVPGKYVILITTKSRMSNKLKRKNLETAYSKYTEPNSAVNHINPSSNQPVLIIDDKVIFHTNCYQELSKIKLSNIYTINICSHAVPIEYYGQNAKNGLIQIWTYSKKQITVHSP